MGLFSISFFYILLAGIFHPISSHRRYMERARIPASRVYYDDYDYGGSMDNPKARQSLNPPYTHTREALCPGGSFANGYRIGSRVSRYPILEGVELCLYSFTLICSQGEATLTGYRHVTIEPENYTPDIITGTIRRWYYWKTRGNYRIFKMQIYGDDVWPGRIWTAPEWPSGPKDITVSSCPSGQGAIGVKGKFRSDNQRPDYLAELELICG